MIVEMSAHTDAIGTETYNQDLSQRRAQSCVDYLISVGIAKDKPIAKGYGESTPIAPHTNPDGSENPEGRPKNRRTIFKVVKHRAEKTGRPRTERRHEGKKTVK